jgi:hypothetical protein
MDALDRLYRRLVQNIRARQPEYLHIPFTVQELYEQLVPYRHNRRELAIETNQDYEVAVARLLSGERGYIESDPTMQDALKQELVSPTGNPGIFKDHAHTQISLSRTGPQTVTTTMPAVTDSPNAASTPPNASPSPVASSAQATQAADAPDAPSSPIPSTPPASAVVRAVYDTLAPSTTIPATAQPSSASLLSSLSHIEVPMGCRFCGGTLPEDRAVNYCPHCGENLKTQRCPACGAEMDTSWKFCITCGRRAS